MSPEVVVKVCPHGSLRTVCPYCLGTMRPAGEAREAATPPKDYSEVRIQWERIGTAEARTIADAILEAWCGNEPGDFTSRGLDALRLRIALELARASR